MGGIRAIFHGSAFAPVVEGVHGDTELSGQLPDRPVVGLNSSPTGRRGGRVFVRPDVHQAPLRSWSRMPRITALTVTTSSSKTEAYFSEICNKPDITFFRDSKCISKFIDFV